VELLGSLRRERDDALWLVLDAGPQLESPTSARALRELALRSEGPAVVAIDPLAPPPAIAWRVPELVILQLPLPGLDELASCVREAAEALEAAGHAGARASLSRADHDIARAAAGLGAAVLERLLAEAVVEHGCDAAAALRHIVAAKPAALLTGALLEPIAPAREDEIGGLVRLRAWLRRRALALRPDAREAGIPDPRGVLLVGVQGCGKSLAARASASILDISLVRLDPGRLFGGTVGESEANLRRALATAERLAPTVLWIDELDKGLAGADGARSDAGTAARVVGGLLTWLAERQRPVFVVATANSIESLPTELVRRGRLDEIFFVDLPDADEREAVLRVHLELIPSRRRNRVPASDVVEALVARARAAEGRTGAEIEAALVEARLLAFAEGRLLRASDLERAFAEQVPLAVSHAESIAALRRWASGRARRA
jgi:SpoVK/Ycf46/Vps4 family AAA+-type ATPase